ncbi:MAG: hypothetical protein ACRDD1_18215, partial [Planctomycetia bacterium]
MDGPRGTIEELSRLAERLVVGLPDPQRSLNNLHRLVHQPGAAAVAPALFADSESLYGLLKLFSHSQFLADAVVNEPPSAVDLFRRAALVKSPAEMTAELTAELERRAPTKDE